MATAEYIGALISLISKSDIRYQGLLASINPNEATIALEQVRSWGTEGRVSAQGRPQEEILPSDHVYEYIMFRAADVKDLKIDDPNPPKQQPPAPQPALNDPAILNSSAPSSGPGGFAPPAGMYGMMPPRPFAAAPYPGAPGFGGPPLPHFNGQPPQQPPVPPSQNTAAPPPAASEPSKPPKPASPPSAEAAKAEEKSSADKVLEEMSKLSVSKPSTAPQQPSSTPSPSSLPHAAHLPAIPHAAAAAAKAAAHSDRRAAGADRSATNGPRTNNHRHRADVGGPSMPNKEFDFESANAKFQKHKETGAAVGGEEAASFEASTSSASQANGGGGLLDAILPPPNAESQGSFYDKSGFFDNISSEIKERYERTTPNAGQEAGGDAGSGLFDAPGGRGGRGGRGGGGRGRGRANRIAEEMKNMQTFGDTGASVGGGSGGGGRGGRGRGGRGGYRGRGGRGGARQQQGPSNGGYNNTAPMRMG
ncbi:related to SCD6 - protein may bind RNA and have a role in RNA processing [Ustilago trichophora]|uniref:Related to SCD6 - protein may bind RNA and have a role in RNA processing n=1 Tax=Ustilago trichophora TaxID=86804 RepID=A0A5C3EL77_9BASI|nr:related to SCD6 - protein may bind RNA and have a role in RNA processing [Ustilago trichophora]